MKIPDPLRSLISDKETTVVLRDGRNSPKSVNLVYYEYFLVDLRHLFL